MHPAEGAQPRGVDERDPGEVEEDGTAAARSQLDDAGSESVGCTHVELSVQAVDQLPVEMGDTAAQDGAEDVRPRQLAAGCDLPPERSPAGSRWRGSSDPRRTACGRAAPATAAVGRTEGAT